MAPRGRSAGRIAVAAGILAGAVVLGGCATIGHPFPTHAVSQIQMNRTTQEEARSLFGEPWRTGVEDGLRTWTYGNYHYSLFGRARTRDLVLRFNDQGVVVSYTFNSTEQEDLAP
jgi:hypothetical protein